jgi:short-subunit dehydrogenase
LVTGASSGIGAATARALADRGARVTLVARRRSQMEAMVSRWPHPERAVVRAGDLREPDVRARLLEDPAPDVVVHNAGISQRLLVREMDAPRLRDLMELNFLAAAELTMGWLPAMLDRGSGHFAVVSSVVGYVSTPLRSGYAASKHALHGFFESLRAETAGTGVGVTIICPGYVKTEVGMHAQRNDDRATTESKGIAAERVAQTLVTAIERRSPEVHVGGPEVWAIYARRWVPSLVRRWAPRTAPDD